MFGHVRSPGGRSRVGMMSGGPRWRPDGEELLPVAGRGCGSRVICYR
ncbi:hypothetical protein L083_3067 [Actinoplanes sp. N902-109]|nr:hypothetical protein L083_3067 [Actinoplanes sp. N902-109]